MLNFDSTRIPDHAFHDVVKTVLSDRNLSGGSNGRAYNFRCPLCGDSKTNINKKRGYVLYSTGHWSYVCHNSCGEMSVLSFLKDYSPDNYRKLVLQGFQSKKVEQITFNVVKEKTIININKLFSANELVSITDSHPQAVQAFEYVQSRKIPKSIWSRWFVCIKDNIFKHKDSKTGLYIGNEYGGRIIIPYYRLGGKWNQFDARALDPNIIPRYRNLKDAEREPYNIDWLDTSKPFFLLEGSIDSTFIPNSISFGGTKHLMSYLDEYPDLLKNAQNGTVIWDNDDAGKDELAKTIKLGFNWFNWDAIKVKKEFEFLENGNKREIKDINDLVLYGDEIYLTYDGIIKLDCLMNYIRKPEGGLVITTMMYGNRERMRREKSKQIFNQMKKRRITDHDIDLMIG